MKQVALNVKTRSAVGTAAAKRLRTAGEIPAVLYGENGAQALSVDNVQFLQAWKKMAGGASLVELHRDGAEESTFAIIKEYQRHAQRDHFMHLDFLEIVRGKEMEADIPVHSKGIANGVKNQQGVLEINAHELTVRCLPRNLPEFIEVDVTALSVGDSLHVRDIAALEGVTFIADPDLVVASCVGSSAGASGSTGATEEVAAAEPAKAAPAKKA